MALQKTTFTTNTQGAVLKHSELHGKDGVHTVFAKGTFNNGILQVQLSPDGTEWFTLADTALAEKGFVSFYAKAFQFRLDFSGGSGSQDVDTWVF